MSRVDAILTRLLVDKDLNRRDDHDDCGYQRAGHYSNT